MKVLITGGDGFVARGIQRYLERDGNYKIDCLGKNELNLLVSDRTLYYDAVIHCAVQGGKRNDKDDLQTFYNNLLMFENLESSITKDTVLINIASGAEFNRETDINNKDTNHLSITPLPRDPYGLSKNIIAKRVMQRKNSYNLRLFGCYGPGEIKDRFIYRCLNEKRVKIHKDIEFDFFYIDDLARVAKFMLEGGIKPRSDRNIVRDFNCVYMRKRNLAEIAYYIKDKFNSDLEIDYLFDESQTEHYTGSGYELAKISIFMKDKLIGFENGLDHYYEANKLLN